MSIDTIDKTDTETRQEHQGQTSSASAKAQKSTTRPGREAKPARTPSKERGRVRGLVNRLGDSTPSTTKIVLIRGGIVVADWLLVVATAVALLPMLGAWLHQASGAQELSMEGAIAFWLVPYLFVAGMIMILEVVLMRGLWQRGTAKIALLVDGDNEAETSASGTAAAQKTTISGSKKNRKRRMK